MRGAYMGSSWRIANSQVLYLARGRQPLGLLISGLETPQYADLTGSSPRSIVLQPLKPLEHEGFVKKPGSFLLLKVSLAEDPTGSRIADWLKSYAPEGVTAVSVEALILKARRLQGLVNQSAFPPGSTFGRLSEGAKTEILRQLQGLNTVLYSADQLSAQTTVSSAEAPLAADSIQAIDQSVEAVCKAVEAPLLLDEPCAGIEEMDQASGDAAAIVGAEEAMSLRRQILNIAVIPGHLELPRDVLHLPRNWKNSQGTIVYERFRSGTFGVGMNQLDILVESFEVEESDDTDVEQIEKKAALLRQTKRASFHILPCIGYISEPLSHTFGFVFERPPDANGETKPVTLNELYKQSRLVPLGLRIRLAHELVAALENYHRVGWVHKAISSDNIIFLPRDPSAPVIPYCVRVDQAPTLVDQAPNIVHLASPWLFGFDDSRPDEDATNLRVDHSLGNNIYRHPDRWSIPRMRFTKAHDVYSLVSQPNPNLIPMKGYPLITESGYRAPGDCILAKCNLQGGHFRPASGLSHTSIGPGEDPRLIRRQMHSPIAASGRAGVHKRDSRMPVFSGEDEEYDGL